MQQISLVQAEYIAHTLAERLMNYDEPMPPFATRYTGKLEACLAQPFQYVGGKPAYFRLTRKTAVLFYGVIKDHPFVNGNKRMAVTLALTFLFLNNKWLEISPDKLYKIACDVASSKPQERDSIVNALSATLSQFITPL